MKPVSNPAIALVSAPWPAFNRPSLQIGALKAYIRDRLPDVHVTADHMYLQVAEALGYRRYEAISKRTWLAESVYAALLYPERKERIEAFFLRQAAGKSALKDVDFNELIERIRQVSEAYVDHRPWGDLILAGFSACLCQLTATLYLVRCIRQRFPDLFTVVGGSMFAGETTRQLRSAFPEIDAVVNGEGELPLRGLVQGLRDGASREALDRIDGVAVLSASGGSAPVSASQLPDLNVLPPPDYDDYFGFLAGLDIKKRFFPILPAEASRGCRWSRTPTGGSRGGCAFCNLNRQWRGYRVKPPARAAAEIDRLTDAYRLVSVAMADNLIPARGADSLFQRLGRLGKDLKLFCEIRATTSRRDLAEMRLAGVTEVQVGIEALSTRLLKKLNKGTRAIINLEIMKNCEELGIANCSNLILQFPGSDQSDVDETLESLIFAAPYRPLRDVRFWLGLGSPVWANPGRFGIRSVFNHPNYLRLFPKSVCTQIDFMIQDYRGGKTVQRKLWRPVKRAVRQWRKEYASLHAACSAGPILSYRDGRGFMIISQRRVSGEPVTHRLEGASRQIYLFCRRHRAVDRITAKFPELGQERIVPFLRMMTAKRLMFEENGKYLSLAVRVR